ncbi:MAG: hypothetical protein WCR16_04105 [Bacilli bacterium]
MKKRLVALLIPLFFCSSLARPHSFAFSKEEVNRQNNTSIRRITSHIDSNSKNGIALRNEEAEIDCLSLKGKQINKSQSYEYGLKEGTTGHEFDYTVNKITKMNGQYCPDGYAVAFGLTGTFYRWWGKYLTRGTQPNNQARIVIANESEMAVGFVLHAIGDSETSYYLSI